MDASALHTDRSVTRRATLGTLGTGVLVMPAGCTGGGSDPEALSTSRTTGPETAAIDPPAEAATASPPAEPTNRPAVETNSCQEQPITTDITIWNESAERQRIEMAIVEIDDDSESLFFETEYIVDGGSSEQEDEHVFQEATPDTHDYRLDVSRGDDTVTEDVTTVARLPTLYGIEIVLRESKTTITTVHGDPGEDHNPNCY